jgi:hypothetical protein
MATWKPSDIVGSSEYIGRRLFRREGLKGAKDQPRPDNTFELYHFEETRDREVSVDRLGQTSLDKKVKAYLEERGRDAAQHLHKATFRGWALTKAKELQTPAKGKPLKIVASPIDAQGGSELSGNRYHAHIEMLPEYDAHDMAIRLKYIFERNYHFEVSGAISDSDSEGFFRRVAAKLRALWRHLNLRCL